MRIGISIASSQPGTDARAGAQNMVERTVAAAAADLDSLFVGDHHVTRSAYYQNSVILPRMLAHWGNKPAGALYLLPLWHPVLLAEQIATMASIAQGRFIMQCGLGGESVQSLGMGVPNAERVGRFEASLTLLRALWAGETVSEDKYWQITDARIAPLPPEPIEVWVGSVVPAALRRTARMAEGWLASPSLTLSDASASIGHYQQYCAEFQRAPTAVAVRRDIYVGADAAEAQAVAQPYIERGYRGFGPDALMVGSVEEVTEQMLAMARAGFTDVIVRNLSRDQAQCLACIERLGEVRSRVHAAL